MPRPGPRHVTAQMETELRRRLAAGEPLPPGFHAVPEGQAPPPGVAPTGVHAQGNGQPIQPPQDLTQFNPVVKGQDAFTLMRNKAECPIPNEAARLQKNIQATLAIKGNHEEVEEVLSDGLATSLRVNSYCETQLRERVAVDFTKTPELAQMTDRILILTDTAETLQNQLKEVVTEARTLIERRWDTAVKSHGLDPSKNFYCMDEKDTQIIDIRVDCATCKGKARVRKSRQKGEELLRHVAEEQRKTALKSVELDEEPKGQKNE